MRGDTGVQAACDRLACDPSPAGILYRRPPGASTTRHALLVSALATLFASSRLPPPSPASPAAVRPPAWATLHVAKSVSVISHVT